MVAIKNATALFSTNIDAQIVATINNPAEKILTAQTDLELPPFDARITD